MATNTSEALDVVGPENRRFACQRMAETIRGQLRCRARASRCITLSGEQVSASRVMTGSGLRYECCARQPAEMRQIPSHDLGSPTSSCDIVLSPISAGCVTTWAVAPPAGSRAHLFGASSRASGFRLPQTIAETHVPTVRRPSPRPRAAQPGLSRRIGAGRMTGDARLSRD